ncbi:hypothetical protein FRC03_008275 [Tulasnella sp. 419]|nr:hypothetical protein FRC03_008275 [Tulasnella sp. 419]
MSTVQLSSVGAQVAHQGSPTPSASSSVSDLTSTAASTEVPTGSIPKHEERIPDEDDFSGKAQVMTLMTTDVDRVAEFSTHFSSLIDAPMEILIGSIFLYHLLGASSFVGLAVTCLFLPLNHYGSKVVFRAQDALMKTRDERVSLMNEILGGMRMLKFMAWERSYEARVLRVRDKELHYQRRNFFIETFFNTVWAASPVLVTVVAFWHYAVIRGIPLTPSVAFTSLSVFNELKFALNALPETFISMLQSFVSVRRIEKYLNLAEVKPVKPLELSPLRLSTFSTEEELPIVLNNATITWPQDQSRYPQWIESSSSSSPPSAVSTPGLKFVLLDLTLNFPKGELSLICGKLGSGKTLLLLGLLGEADLLGGQIICPRSPPDVIAKSAELRSIPDVEWIVPGVCAYVPQTAWLQNATIRDNILFNLPYNEQRYRATVEACCLLTDFEILEDGDHSEIGERGVTLSGGQKARVSLARAIYSRASILLLDDVLSAVDAHTASNIYENALKGPLTKNRTVILVSHHVQLTAPGASYIVALDNGQLRYAGDRQGFKSSGVMSSLVQSTALETPIIMMETKQLPPDDLQIGDLQLSPPEGDGERSSDAEVSDTMVNSSEGIDSDTGKQKKPRKLIQEEQRAFGNIRRRIWLTYVSSCGGYVFWLSFAFVLLFASISPVIENGWLKIWSAAYKDPDARSPLWYMSIYAGLTAAGLIIATIRWLVLYQGSIHASRILYQRLLESVLFANIRFHDTTNRGRLLNRFGKDFEGLDSSLATNMGRTLIGSLTVATTFITVAVIGGPWFILAALFIAMFFYRVAVVYSHTSRDLRRLDSVTRSPLYTIYGESIGGATVLRAFGASTKFLREMHQLVNTNNVCYYWMLSVNRWLNIRFNLLSSAIVGLVGVVILWNPKIDAALAGFLLSFVQSVSNSLM